MLHIGHRSMSRFRVLYLHCIALGISFLLRLVVLRRCVGRFDWDYSVKGCRDSKEGHLSKC